MKEVLSGTDIKQIFANFSGHLHQDGHQLLAHAIFEKIEQERAALGFPGLRSRWPEDPGSAIWP